MSDDGGSDETEAALPWWLRRRFARRVLFPLVTVGSLITALVVFHHILIPFIFACAIVYLMEPVVVRISRTPGGDGGLPRWLSVILVYLVFLSTVTAGTALVAPQFVKELKRFAETAPQTVQRFREQRLPGINARIQDYLRAMSGPEERETETPSADPQPAGERQAAFQVRQTPEGLDVYLNEDGVEIARLDDGHWSVRPRTPNSGASAGGLHAQFDLERRIDATIQDAVTFSAEQLSSMAEFLQHLVASVLETFIKVILTFMVAAFISIDLPRFMDFFRQLVPEDLQGGYDELLERVDRGLSGVVRGQLIICLVNGVLTYIGLAMLGVKFSLLLSLVAGILSIIPVFGSVISTIPICLIALTQGLMTGLLVLGWILLIHFVEANILNPKIIGTSAEIHPVIVIFALLAGESTGGLFGAIVAVPIASMILSVFKFVRDRVWEQEASEPGIDGTVS